jgi:hypothetical protein
VRTHDHDHEARPDPPEPVLARHEQAGPDAQRALSQRRPEALTPGALLHLQRTAGNAGVGSLLDADQLVPDGGGQPLEPATRQAMEERLGADLSSVRVHTGPQAAAAAASVQARAYTVGDDVVFGEGHYQPGTPAGDRTLAHELTHVLQQRAGPVDGTDTGSGFRISDPDDRFERAAEETAERVSAGVRVGDVAGGAPAGVQRAAAEGEPEEEELQGSFLQRQEEEMPEEEEPAPGA